ATEVGLDRELGLELRLQLELRGVVALVLRAARDERPERSRLEAVDPVHRVLPALELERGREELPAEPLRLELGRDGVHARDLVLEVGVADYHPLEAVRVGLAIELRALRRRDSLQELLDLLVGGGELACRQRLEDDRADACRLERALGLERDRRRADREEPLGGRRLQLL